MLPVLRKLCSIWTKRSKAGAYFIDQDNSRKPLPPTPSQNRHFIDEKQPILFRKIPVTTKNFFFEGHNGFLVKILTHSLGSAGGGEFEFWPKYIKRLKKVVLFELSAKYIRGFF